MGWIACDWGTTRLRVWAMKGDAPVAEASSGNGMNGLDRSGYEPALLDLVAPWLGAGVTPVVACGMVGSRQGWVEAPYAAVPAPPLSGDLAAAPVAEPRLSVHVVPGLKQHAPADVMRGEETQIAGLLAGEPGFDGVVCLPGTHTKWARVSAGEVVGFRTAMTGELFSLLSAGSVLRHTLGEGWGEAAFSEAVADALSKPEALAARLFTIRAEGLLTGLEPGAARARLSGLLIGAELAALKPYWLGQDVAIVGDEGLSARYAEALSLQGVTPRLLDATATTLAGLAAARARLKETAT